MPSTFSPALRLELIGNGEQAANWGNTTNTNLGTLLEQAITGVGNITMLDANYTLVSSNGISDEARNAVLVVTGTLTVTRSLIVPTSNKFYAVRNATTGGQSILVRTSGGTGVTLPNGFTQLMYCDGTNVVLATVPINASTGSVVLDNPTINGFTGNTAVINVGSGQFYKDVSGNIGIGTTSPTAKVDVVSAGTTLASVQARNAGTTVYLGADNGYSYLNTFTNVPMLFGTNNVERMRVSASGNVGIGTAAPAVRLAVSSTDAILVPVGTTAERPAGATGYIRFNTTTLGFEGYDGTSWGSIGGGATGGNGDKVFYLNSTTVTSSYSIPNDQNAGTFGPVTVDSGAVITIPSGSTWTVV